MIKRRVVITGGSGRIGRYVVREIMASHDITNMDIKKAEESIDYVEANIMDLDAVRKATKGADAVIHLAALDLHINADPEKFIHVNTQGTWHVLQAAHENGIRKVVLCSSVSACGLSEMRPEWKPQFLPVDESHECRPVHAYSVSKIIMEQMALSFAQGTDMSVICLRPLAVVMQENLHWYIQSVDDPDRHWLFYYVTAKDVARAFHLAVDIVGYKYGIFFLSADDTSRPEETLDWYTNRIGDPPQIISPHIYRLNPRASIFSNASAQNVLGWRPTSDFNEMRKYALGNQNQPASGL